ncbi:MAG: BamA/TamA family outer membrane protein, partial [Endomicrobium sp.]|nr:BamA/TamA family outer membrane protein [Endomicrobium sp.]
KEQDITSGTLFISIIEGVISKAQVSGNKSTSEKYIKRYIDFGKTDNFNANVTDKEIMNFNASNDAKARIALSPGEVFGSSVVDIIIDEPQRYSLSIFTDNAGQEETGKIRYAGYGSIKSITKYRDIFNAGGVFSEGSNAAYASYEIPEPFFNARVGAGFDYSDTYIVNGGLKPLDVKGSFYNAYIYVKKPFFIREKTVTNVTFNAASKHGVSFVSDFKTQDTKTDTLSLSADNTLLFNGGYAFNMLSYAQGAKIIEGENIFEKLAYYGEGYKSLPYNFSLNLKIKGQLIFDKAPSSEYFSIGGINSVRGYREGMLTAKDGVNTNLELIYDIGLIKWKRLNFNKIYAFFDFGNVFPDKNANLPDGYSNMLYSCGIGIKFGLFRHFETNLVCAFPLYEHKYYENDKITLLFSIHGKI